MGGRHSVQGFFDDVNLLTLNPYTVDGMKDFVEAQMGKCAGEQRQMFPTTGWRASWDGLCLANNGEQILAGGGEWETQKTKTQNPLLWPLCFHRTLDLGKTCCLEN